MAGPYRVLSLFKKYFVPGNGCFTQLKAEPLVTLLAYEISLVALAGLIPGSRTGNLLMDIKLPQCTGVRMS
ncbi:MAG: hypothetical protein WDO19_24585 [Bacteroidota bacterium]